MRRQYTQGPAVTELSQEDDRDEELDTQLLAPAVDSSLPTTKQDLKMKQLSREQSPAEEGEGDQADSGPKKNIYQHDNS